jgi:hypothetical protein
MTMHAAKGLEFPVVVVADLGRAPQNQTADLLVDGDRVGLRLRTVDGGRADALEWEALRDARRLADAEEERRILHVAMTRAEERLILSGTFEADKWLSSPQPAIAPVRWLAPRLVADLTDTLAEAAGETTTLGDPDPTATRPRVSLRLHREPPDLPPSPPSPIAVEASGPGHTEPIPEDPSGQLTLDLFAPPPEKPRRVFSEASGPAEEAAGSAEVSGPAQPFAPAEAAGSAKAAGPAEAVGPAEPSAPVRGERGARAEPVAPSAPPGSTAPPAVPAARAPRADPPRPLPATLSYSSLAAYDRCAYRWYLERVLRLPRDDAGGPQMARAERPAGPVEGGLDALTRGSLAHALLEDLDFARPQAPAEEQVRALAEFWEAEVTDADVADLQQLVAAFAGSAVAARLAEATDVRREHGFVVGLGDEHAPLLNGVIDVLAFEPDGSALVVDYKSDVVGPETDLEAYVEADYGAQRRIYALAALGAGATDVEIAHLFLHRAGEPAVAIYDRSHIPQLRVELDERVAGIAAGRFVPTDRPHRALCATCPGRRALCHHPEELTLREEPEPVG